MLKKQSAVSLISVVIIMALLGIIGVFGSQIGIGYLTKNNIQKAARDVLAELKPGENYSPQKIKDMLSRKFAGQVNIDLDERDINVSRDGSKYVIETSYHKEVKITNEVRLCMDFEIIETQK